MKTNAINKHWCTIALALVMFFGSFSLIASEKTQIHIKVTDSNNQPIHGIMASLRKANSTTVIKSATNEKEEQITLDQIKKGQYVIFICRNDFSNSIVASFEITNIEKQPVEISVIFGEKEIVPSNINLIGATRLETINNQNL